MQERLCQPEPLLHALRVAADAELLAAGEAEQFEQLGCAVPSLLPRQALQPAVDIEQARAGVILGKPVILRQVTHLAACVDAPHRLPQQVR